MVPTLNLCFYTLLIFFSPIFVMTVQGRESNSTTDERSVSERARSTVEDFMSATSVTALWQARIEWDEKLSGEEKAYVLAELQSRLIVSKALKLTDWGSLFIPSRGDSGKMVWHGHGLLIEQDIFITAGRAAWGIEGLLHITLPKFAEAHTQEQLQMLQRECVILIIRNMRLPRENVREGTQQAGEPKG